MHLNDGARLTLSGVHARAGYLGSTIHLLILSVINIQQENHPRISTRKRMIGDEDTRHAGVFFSCHPQDMDFLTIFKFFS
jgi:hypothetical protein